MYLLDDSANIKYARNYTWDLLHENQYAWKFKFMEKENLEEVDEAIVRKFWIWKGFAFFQFHLDTLFQPYITSSDGYCVFSSQENS